MACKICGCPEVRWLRVSTVATELKCSPKCVRRLIKRGAIDAVRVGRQWRVDHKSLDDYVRRGSVRFWVPDAEAPW